MFVAIVTRSLGCPISTTEGRQADAPKSSLVVPATVLTAAGVALATIGGDGVITACYSKNNGDLRVIDAETGASCKDNEAALSWNQQGPAGDPGPQGVPGPQGPPGPQGEPGGLATVYEKTTNSYIGITYHALMISGTVAGGRFPRGAYYATATATLANKATVGPGGPNPHHASIYCQFWHAGGPVTRLDGTPIQVILEPGNGETRRATMTASASFEVGPPFPSVPEQTDGFVSFGCRQERTSADLGATGYMESLHVLVVPVGSVVTLN